MSLASCPLVSSCLMSLVSTRQSPLPLERHRVSRAHLSQREETCLSHVSCLSLSHLPSSLESLVTLCLSLFVSLTSDTKRRETKRGDTKKGASRDVRETSDQRTETWGKKQRDERHRDTETQRGDMSLSCLLSLLVSSLMT